MDTINQLVDCDICGVKLSVKNLNKHKLLVHKIQTTPTFDKYMHLCSVCADDGQMGRFKTSQAYITHLNESHKDTFGEVTTHTKTFKSLTEFQEFKHDLEIQRKTHFSKRNSKRSSKDNNNIVFFRCNRYCHPSMAAKPSQRKPGCTGPTRKRSKTKVTASCPVFLTTTTTKNGTIEAKFCLDHIGHEVELDHNINKKTANSEERSKMIEDIIKINEDFAKSSNFKCGSLKTLQNLKRSLEQVYIDFDNNNPYVVGKKLVMDDVLPVDTKPLVVASPKCAPREPKIARNSLNRFNTTAFISTVVPTPNKVIQAVVPPHIAQKIVPTPPKPVQTKVPPPQFPQFQIAPTYIWIPNVIPAKIPDKTPNKGSNQKSDKESNQTTENKSNKKANKDSGAKLEPVEEITEIVSEQN